MTCTTDGRCVPKATGTCHTNDDCTDGLVCKMGTCTACDVGSTDCGPGETCLPSGTCIEVSTGAGGNGAGGGTGGGGANIRGRVQGGACTCTAAGSNERDGFALSHLRSGAGVACTPPWSKPSQTGGVMPKSSLLRCCT